MSQANADGPVPAQTTRTRILDAAASLMRHGGRDAATTRAVAAAADVQAPTIYRLFGDKQGLLDAVAVHCLQAHVADKNAQPPNPDPLEALREGWDAHVAFCLAHPWLFAILCGDASQTGTMTRAQEAGLDVLRQRVKNLARAGRLQTSEARAVDLLRSVAIGTVWTLLERPMNQRDAGLSVAAREAVMSVIAEAANASTGPGVGPAAVTLRASLDQVGVLSDGERLLLAELLERMVRDA